MWSVSKTAKKMPMTDKIVQTSEPIALFGGGEARSDTVSRALAVCNSVAAADGGAKHALGNGVIPDAVIGDFDSLSEAELSELPAEVLHRIDEQDSTDFDKALRHISAPAIVAVGFTGARLDHTLAAMNTLVTRADQRCLILNENEVVYVAPPRMELDLPIGTIFSLFPMGPVQGASDGLVWPIDGIDFAPDGRVGTSNEVNGPVTIEADAPNMLVLVPADHFETVLEQLMRCDAHWPARAG